MSKWWTEEEDRLLETLSADGRSAAYIGRIMSRSRCSVLGRVTRKRDGVAYVVAGQDSLRKPVTQSSPKLTGTRWHITKEQRAKVIAAVRAGDYSSKIARVLGTSRRTINKIASEAGVKLVLGHGMRRPRKFTEEQRQEALALINAGKTAAQIGAHFGISDKVFRSRRKVDPLLLSVPMKGGRRPGSPKREDDDQIRVLASAGHSAREIGEALGKTKDTIIGRTRKLGIKLHGRPGGNRGGNVIAFPGSRHVRPVPSLSSPSRPQLTVITNVERLIADHIARHGVRRFAAGETADYYSLQSWLRDRGYALSKSRSLYSISNGRGHPKVMPWANVVSFVDDIREREGLPTFGYRSGSKEAHP